MPTMVPLICNHCNILFDRNLRDFNISVNRRNQKKFYCSRRCTTEARINKQTFLCTECTREFQRIPAEAKKSKNHFCSLSCAATYNNKHKTYWCRRSKLEIYIEEQVSFDFPKLELICNDKEAIGSELDFYFPELRFAIELNGIFHYEPIYGNDKLKRIQNNDKNKLIRCYEEGIELAIIDSSQCKHLTQKAKDKYYGIVKELLSKIIRRSY
jgi:hypothetical protein